MYRKHVFVYTKMFWWTTILYTLPITEQELILQCEIFLVYIKDSVYGELEKIRPPMMNTTQKEPEKDAKQTTSEGGPVKKAAIAVTEPVITESTSDSWNKPTVITQNVTQGNQLPGIDTFLSKVCTVPMKRCNFAQVYQDVANRPKPVYPIEVNVEIMGNNENEKPSQCTSQ